MPTNQFHKVTVQLVTHNSEKYLPFLLSSLINQSYAAFDTLILDNASTDQTVNYLKERYPRLRLITSQQNLGFAKGHNQLLNWQKSEYILFLNHDLILDKNYLTKAVAILDAQPDVAAVGGKLYRWDYEQSQQTNPPRLTLVEAGIIDSTGLILRRNHQVVDRGAGEEDTGQYNQAEEVFGVSGALFLARRSALEAVKLPRGAGWEYFDQDFISYKEDIDLMYRLRLAGFKIWYLPTAIAWHERNLKQGSDHKINRQNRSQLFNLFSYKNHLAVIIKNEPLINLFEYSPWILWYEFKKLGWLLLFERSTLKGLGNLLVNLPSWLKKRKYIKNRIKKISPEELAKWYVK